MVPETTEPLRGSVMLSWMVQPTEGVGGGSGVPTAVAVSSGVASAGFGAGSPGLPARVMVGTSGGVGVGWRVSNGVGEASGVRKISGVEVAVWNREAGNVGAI